MCVCVCVCAWIHACMHTCISMCVCVCVCVCLHVCAYTEYLFTCQCVFLVSMAQITAYISRLAYQTLQNWSQHWQLGENRSDASWSNFWTHPDWNHTKSPCRSMLNSASTRWLVAFFFCLHLLIFLTSSFFPLCLSLCLSFSVFVFSFLFTVCDC